MSTARLRQSSSSMMRMSALCMTSSELSNSSQVRRSSSTTLWKKPSRRTISLAASVCSITEIKTDFCYSTTWSFFLTAFLATQQDKKKKTTTSTSWTSTRKITTKSMAKQPWWTSVNSPRHLRDFSSAIGRSTETLSWQFSLETTILKRLNQLLVWLISWRTDFQVLRKQIQIKKPIKLHSMEKKSRRLRNQLLRIYLLLTTPRWSTKFCLCSPSCQSSCPSNSLSRTSKA